MYVIHQYSITIKQSQKKNLSKLQGAIMYSSEYKKFYTPQFSETASVSVRRFAWFLNKPMTQAIEKLILLLPFLMNAEKVCQACKDSRKCGTCAFSVKNMSEEEKYKILSSI